MVASTAKKVTKKQQNKKAQKVDDKKPEVKLTEEQGIKAIMINKLLGDQEATKTEDKPEIKEMEGGKVEEPKTETKKKVVTKKQATKKATFKEVKKKTIPKTKKQTKKEEDTKPEDVKEEDKQVGEGQQIEDKKDKKRKFNIYYNGSMIEGACVTGLRPKQAAMKALSVIINNFFKDKKTKTVDKSVIGKELKFYLEESEGYGKNKKFKRFFYKGQKGYIVTKDTKDEYQKKMKKPVEFIEDDDGVIGIVAKHVTIGGGEKKIIHKYVNTVFMDREAAKEFREAESKKKEESD